MGTPVRALCSDQEVLRNSGYSFQVEPAVFAVGLCCGMREIKESWITPEFLYSFFFFFYLNDGKDGDVINQGD